MSTFGLAEAFASWQWVNYLINKVSAGKKPLLINMDETAVCLFQGTGRGTIIAGKKRKRGRGEPVQLVNRATRRTYLTHVAFICDQPLYQKYMPQIVIGNEHTLLVRDMPELQRNRPSHFTLIRQKSAWNNTQLMCTIVDKLWMALAPFAAKVQPILLMDAAKLHWAIAVMNKCKRRGIWPLPVPAKLTWLLQPCDTHMFQVYKLHLRKAYQRRREEAMTGGALPVKQLLDCVYETSEHVVEDISGWKRAFLDDGYGANKQARLSVFRKRHLELEAAPEVGDHLPSLDQVKLCFPARATIPPMSKLFHCSAIQALPSLAPPTMLALPPPSGVPRGVRLPGPALPSASSRASAGGSSLAALGGREPRTRSEHRLAGHGPAIGGVG